MINFLTEDYLRITGHSFTLCITIALIYYPKDYVSTNFQGMIKKN